MIGGQTIQAATTAAGLGPGALQPPAIQGGPNPTALFGIFDGHGGVEVAEFVSRTFEEVLKSSPHYKTMNYEAALQETFLRMDELLQTSDGKAQIVEIHKQHPANVSQLEKALVASGSIKGRSFNFLINSI